MSILKQACQKLNASSSSKVDICSFASATVELEILCSVSLVAQKLQPFPQLLRDIPGWAE